VVLRPGVDAHGKSRSLAQRHAWDSAAAQGSGVMELVTMLWPRPMAQAQSTDGYRAPIRHDRFLERNDGRSSRHVEPHKGSAGS
jgi:hypothetical protein